MPGETPAQTYARYLADYHSADVDAVLASIRAWMQGPTLEVLGPPPDGVTLKPGETPLQVLARYTADFHDSNAAEVIADLRLWVQGKLSKRPPAKRQPPLPPFDHDDPGGRVATTLPPEQVIPAGPDRDWWRGDFGGVTTRETPPFIPGANTTPPNMWMTFLLHRYSRAWQDIFLKEYCERGYTHILLGAPDDRKDPAAIAAQVEFFKYVQSYYGLFTAYWATSTGDAPQYKDKNWKGIREIIEPFLRALIAAGKPEKSIMIVGEELNSWNKPGPDGLDDIIANICAICNPVDLPVWLHFTSNHPSWQPGGMTPTTWWQQWVGRVKGLCWQATSNDPAGSMAAHMWDARKYLGAASTQLKVVAFELRASEQLFGHYTEEQGCLTGWEMICATRGGTNFPPVSGFMNGARRPGGEPI